MDGFVSMTDIHGLKPALPIAPGFWFWLVMASLMLVLGRYLWFIGRSRVAPETGKTEFRARNPKGVSALGQLARLDGPEWLRAERARDFHFKLSHILRAVLNAHFACPAQRLTTSELLGRLDAASVDAGELGRLGALLENCDLVKFSHVSVRTEEMVYRLQEAQALVQGWGDVTVRDQLRETGSLTGG